MTAADLPFILRLKGEAGWNQTENDIRRCLALAPDGCFVAEYDANPAGTAAALVMGRVGWIAMVLVDPRLRRRGIGEALMRRALQSLDACDVHTVRLDATPMGQGIYARLGFVADSLVARYTGIAALPSGPPFEGLRAYTGTDFAAIVDLDRAATGMDRRELYRRLLADNPGVTCVAERGGCFAGFVTTRTGAQATQVGPCMATDPSAGRDLLADALRRQTGRNVFVDVPVGNADGARVAAAAGLTVQRHLTRMVKGPPSVARPELIWSTFGPEKG